MNKIIIGWMGKRTFKNMKKWLKEDGSIMPYVVSKKPKKKDFPIVDSPAIKVEIIIKEIK